MACVSNSILLSPSTAEHSTLTQQEAYKVGRSPSGLAALRGRAAEGQMSGEDCNLTSIV